MNDFRFCILFLITIPFTAAANSTYSYIIHDLSLNWDDDQCKRWPKFDVKKSPSDLNMMQLNGPIKKLTMDFKHQNKPIFKLIAHYDRHGNLINRTGSIPNHDTAVILKEETKIVSPPLVECCGYLKKPIREYVTSNTNYGISINKNKLNQPKTFFQYKEEAIDYLLNKNKIPERRYLIKITNVSAKENKKSPSNIELEIKHYPDTLRYFSYDSKKRILKYKWGSLLGIEKHPVYGYLSQYVDDKHPYVHEYYYDKEGRLQKEKVEFSADDKGYYIQEYTWDNSNRIIKTKFTSALPSNDWNEKYTLNNYRYANNQYTAVETVCIDRKCKTGKPVKKSCYQKRDTYGNALLRQFDSRIPIEGKKLVITVNNQYEYYKPVVKKFK